MISKRNSDFGVGGILNFYRNEFNTHDHKNHYCELKSYLVIICIQFKLIYGTVDEKLPLGKIRKTSYLGALSKWLPRKKYWNFSISNYQRYTKFTSRCMFLMMTNTMILVTNSLCIKKYFKIQDGRQFCKINRFSIWNQLICQSQYCLNRAKTKGFKVLWVFIAN